MFNQAVGREITVQDGFDPYHKWLGIPPQDQPPHHYRLLAIPLFESDPEVIESAADQRMGHVRTFQRGHHSALSQQILNELAAARVCLLARDKKLAYDAELRASLAPAPPLPPPKPAHVSTILPSPPPPAGHSPLPPPVPNQTGGEILPPPAGSVLSQLRPVFPPMDATLPDPAPPSMTIARAAVAGRSRRFSLVASVLSIALLLSAAAVLWMLYRGQTTADAVSIPALDSTQAHAVPDSVTPPRDATDQLVADSEPPEGREAIATSPDMKEELASEAATEADEGRESLMPLAEERLEPAAQPSPGAVDAAMSEAEPVLPARPSLAEVLEQAMPVTDDSQDSARETVDRPEEDETAEKLPYPKPLAFKRLTIKLMAYRKADYNTLIAEAQKPDRHFPEAYVLLSFAYDNAQQANDAERVLQTVDIIESRFTGSYDQMRVTALSAIQRQLSSDARQSRNLANVALQASQEALQAENKTLAVALGTIALNAAKSSRQPDLEGQVMTYLRGL